MSLRRPASRGLFVLGCALLGSAIALLLAARFIPAQSMEGLGRIVGGLFLAGAAGIPFGLSLFFAQGTRMPRWMLATAAAGCLLALIPAYIFLMAGVTGSMLFGALFFVASLLGVFYAIRLWSPRAAA